VTARARLRRGNTASAVGAGRLLAQALTTVRAAGVTGQVLCRADLAYYGWAFVGTALCHQAWFSVTARMDPKVKATIGNNQGVCLAGDQVPRGDLGRGRGALDLRRRGCRGGVHRVHRSPQGRARHLPTRGAPGEATRAAGR